MERYSGYGTSEDLVDEVGLSILKHYIALQRINNRRCRERSPSRAKLIRESIEKMTANGELD